MELWPTMASHWPLKMWLAMESSLDLHCMNESKPWLWNKTFSKDIFIFKKASCEAELMPITLPSYHITFYRCTHCPLLETQKIVGSKRLGTSALDKLPLPATKSHPHTHHGMCYFNISLSGLMDTILAERQPCSFCSCHWVSEHTNGLFRTPCLTSSPKAIAYRQWSNEHVATGLPTILLLEMVGSP